MLKEMRVNRGALPVGFYLPENTAYFLAWNDHSTINAIGPFDPFYEALYHTVISGGVEPLSTFFPGGFPPGEGYSTRIFESRPTVGSTRLPQTFGQRRLKIIQALLEGNTDKLSDPTVRGWQSDRLRDKTNDTSHISPRGVVVIEDPFRFWGPNDLYTLPTNHSVGIVLHASGGNISSWDPAEISLYYPLFWTTSLFFCNAWKPLREQVWDSQGQITRYFKSFNHSPFEGEYCGFMEYEYYWIWSEWYTPYRFRITGHVRVTFDRGFHAAAGPVIDGWTWGLSDLMNPTATFSTRYTVDYQVKEVELPPYGPADWTKYAQTAFPDSCEKVIQLQTVLAGSMPSGVEEPEGFKRVLRYNPVSSSYETNSRTLLDILYKESYQLFSDTRAIHTISGADAVDLALAGIQANSLQNLLQGVNAYALIEDVRLAYLCYQRLVNKDYVSAGLTFIDLLTNAYLLYNFDILPTIRDAIEFVHNIGPIIKSLKSSDFYDRDSVGRGAAYFSVPSEYALFQSCLLRAHTLACFRVSDTTLVHALLPGRLLNILPTLTNVWQSKSWSFVVDWFAGISGKTRIADSQLFALCLDVSGSVSSSLIDWPIPPEILEENGLLAVELPVIRIFERVVEDLLPSYYPTHLDFAPAPKFKSGKWLIAGCLAYQIMS